MRVRLSTALLAVTALFAARAAAAWTAGPGPDPQPPGLRLPAAAAPVSYSVRLTIDPERPVFQGAVDVEVRLVEQQR